MKRLTQRGRHINLPIVGDTVSEVCLSMSRLCSIVFQDSGGGESQVEFEEAITLVRGDVTLYLVGSRPGRTYAPQQLGPLADLLGASVVDAWAHHDGPLEIVFSNDWTLRVVPESGYEAWHFAWPRPGRSPGGDTRHSIHLHGDDSGFV